MLNQSGVTKVSATTPKSILWAPENAIAFPCIVANTGMSAGDGGKKILQAGTPITGDLTQRNNAFTLAKTASTNIGTVEGAGTNVKTNKSNAVGLVLHTVDVTTSKQNATILVAGVVDLNKLDRTTAALITAEVKAALPNIIFVK